MSIDSLTSESVGSEKKVSTGVSRRAKSSAFYWTFIHACCACTTAFVRKEAFQKHVKKCVGGHVSKMSFSTFPHVEHFEEREFPNTLLCPIVASFDTEACGNLDISRRVTNDGRIFTSDERKCAEMILLAVVATVIVRPNRKLDYTVYKDVSMSNDELLDYKSTVPWEIHRHIDVEDDANLSCSVNEAKTNYITEGYLTPATGFGATKEIKICQHWDPTFKDGQIKRLQMSTITLTWTEEYRIFIIQKKISINKAKQMVCYNPIMENKGKIKEITNNSLLTMEVRRTTSYVHTRVNMTFMTPQGKKYHQLEITKGRFHIVPLKWDNTQIPQVAIPYEITLEHIDPSNTIQINRQEDQFILSHKYFKNKWLNEKTSKVQEIKELTKQLELKDEIRMKEYKRIKSNYIYQDDKMYRCDKKYESRKFVRNPIITPALLYDINKKTIDVKGMVTKRQTLVGRNRMETDIELQNRLQIDGVLIETLKKGNYKWYNVVMTRYNDRPPTKWLSTGASVSEELAWQIWKKKNDSTTEVKIKTIKVQTTLYGIIQQKDIYKIYIIGEHRICWGKTFLTTIKNKGANVRMNCYYADLVNKGVYVGCDPKITGDNCTKIIRAVNCRRMTCTDFTTTVGILWEAKATREIGSRFIFSPYLSKPIEIHLNQTTNQIDYQWKRKLPTHMNESMRRQLKIHIQKTILEAYPKIEEEKLSQAADIIILNYEVTLAINRTLMRTARDQKWRIIGFLYYTNQFIKIKNIEHKNQPGEKEYFKVPLFQIKKPVKEETYIINMNKKTGSRIQVPIIKGEGILQPLGKKGISITRNTITWNIYTDGIYTYKKNKYVITATGRIFWLDLTKTVSSLDQMGLLEYYEVLQQLKTASLTTQLQTQQGAREQRLGRYRRGNELSVFTKNTESKYKCKEEWSATIFLNRTLFYKELPYIPVILKGNLYKPIVIVTRNKRKTLEYIHRNVKSARNTSQMNKDKLVNATSDFLKQIKKYADKRFLTLQHLRQGFWFIMMAEQYEILKLEWIKGRIHKLDQENLIIEENTYPDPPQTSDLIWKRYLYSYTPNGNEKTPIENVTYLQSYTFKINQEKEIQNKKAREEFILWIERSKVQQKLERVMYKLTQYLTKGRQQDKKEIENKLKKQWKEINEKIRKNKYQQIIQNQILKNEIINI